MTIVDESQRIPQTPPALPDPSSRNRAAPRFVVGLVMVLIGGLWLLERTGAVDLNVTSVLALGTVTTGVALMFLARDGIHLGLVVFGTILGLLTLVTLAAPFEGFQGGIGDRTFLIGTVDEIEADYNLSMGKLVLDLSTVDDFDVETTLSASIGMGELLIVVPDGTAVSVDARIGAGQLEVFGELVDGVGIDRSFTSPGFGDGPGIELDLAAFAGRVEVRDE